MKNICLKLSILFSLFFLKSIAIVAQEKAIGTLEVVAELEVTPGNVAVSKEGRIFSSIHPFRPSNYQLVEITGKSTYVPFPNEQVQSTSDNKSDNKLDAPLGIIFDNKNRLWVLDVGLNIGHTRLFSYDIDTRKEVLRFDIPLEFAPSTSFVQDLVVDEINGFVYLADVRNPGIIVIDIRKNEFSKIIDIPSMQPEDIDIIIDNKVHYRKGKPVRIALDAITISVDRDTLYYGPMNGTKWYKVPTKQIREGAENEEIIKHIAVVGKKPICDGAATDENYNHYFTNIQNNSIDVLSKDGTLSTLKKSPFFDWPDSVRIQGDWLYIATNQIHKSPAFGEGIERSTGLFRILKLKFK